MWLAYGENDRLREAIALLEPVLRPEQILVREGGHSWRVWTPATRAVPEASDRARLP